jgi:hypothetical protein
MEHADPIAPVSFPERVSARRERTTPAAWKEVAASLLLHLFVGAVAIGALSGPAEIPPPVIDLTLAEPSGEGPPSSTGSEEARVRRTDAPVAATRSDGPSALAPPAPAASFPTATEPANLTGTAPALSDRRPLRSALRPAFNFVSGRRRFRLPARCRRTRPGRNR